MARRADRRLADRLARLLMMPPFLFTLILLYSGGTAPVAALAVGGAHGAARVLLGTCVAIFHPR